MRYNEDTGMPRVIGFAGPARAGKDTAADYIVGNIGVYDKLSFADPIKEMLRRGFGIGSQHLNGDLKEAKIEWIGKSAREMMQTLGTEWGREMIHPDIWVMCMNKRVQEEDHVVIADVRFENEVKFVRENGVLVHIEGRGGIDGDHKSEAGVTPVDGDLHLYNDGDIYKFRRELRCLTKKFIMGIK